MRETVSPDELLLIATVDGRQWWQRREGARSHISSLFSNPLPCAGDWLIEVIDDDTFARSVNWHGKRLRLGSRFMLDVIQPHENSGWRIVRRREDGRQMRLVDVSV